MYHTLLGPEGFAHGMAKYTSDFDQQVSQLRLGTDHEV